MAASLHCKLYIFTLYIDLQPSAFGMYFYFGEISDPGDNIFARLQSRELAAHAAVFKGVQIIFVTFFDKRNYGNIAVIDINLKLSIAVY